MSEHVNMVKQLRKLSGLTHLDLSRSPFTTRDVQAVLPNLPKLIYLDLSATHIDRGLDLSSLTDLRTLRLRDVYWRDDGFVTTVQTTTEDLEFLDIGRGLNFGTRSGRLTDASDWRTELADLTLRVAPLPIEESYPLSKFEKLTAFRLVSRNSQLTPKTYVDRIRGIATKNRALCTISGSICLG